jgi:hypothetical protein
MVIDDLFKSRSFKTVHNKGKNKFKKVNIYLGIHLFYTYSIFSEAVCAYVFVDEIFH